MNDKKSKFKIYLADYAGFCFGVKRAINIAYQNISKEKVYTLGPLIHNPQVIEELKEKNILHINDLEEVPENSKLIIRAHGVSPRIVLEAEKKNVQVIDATCPFVKKVHEYVKDMDGKAYQVLIFGEKDHPEVIGIKDNAENPVIIQELSDVKDLGYYPKAGLVSQTTQSVKKLEEVIKELENHAGELKVYNTICDATQKRQGAATSLAKKVELMIVIGGYNSGNTRRLAELCNKIVQTQHIETFEDLNLDILEKKQKIGVTAGASTPSGIIENVINNILLIKKQKQ